MSIFLPFSMIHSVLDVTPDYIKSLGASGVLLDVDNTLAKHGEPEPLKGIAEWLKRLSDNNISCIIVSNNFRKRVEPFAHRIGVGFVSMGGKPLGYGIRRACRALKIDRSQVVLIGDQILTDVVGGNLQGIKTILVDPIVLEQTMLFKIKRRIEKYFIKKFNQRKERGK